MATSMEGIDKALSSLTYRPDSLKFRLVHALRRRYDQADWSTTLTNIDSETLIRELWGIEDDPAAISAKRKNLSSIKSSINGDLKNLYKEGNNPEGVCIGRNNLFSMSDDAKDELLSNLASKVKLDSEETGTLTQIRGLLAQIQELMAQQKEAAKGQPSPAATGDIANALRSLAEGLTKELSTGSTPNQQEGQKGPPLSENPNGDDIGKEDEFTNNEELDIIEEELQDDELEEATDDLDAELDDSDIVDVVEELIDDNEEELPADGEDEDQDVIEEELQDDELEEATDDLDAELDDSDIVDVVEELIDDNAEELPADDEDEDQDVIEEELQNDEIEEATDDLDTELDDSDIVDVVEELIDDNAEELPADDEDEDQDVIEEELQNDEIELQDDETEETTDDLDAELDDSDIVDVIEEDIPDDEDADEDEILEDPPPADDLATDLIGPEGDLDDPDDADLKARRLSESFQGYLSAMEKTYNQYLLIPKGTYTVGSRIANKDEQPEQRVLINDFYIGRFPVTTGLFEVFIEKTGYKTTAEKIGHAIVYSGRYSRQTDKASGDVKFVCNAAVSCKSVRGACWYQPLGPGSDLHGKRHHPVVQVTVEDAMAFASWTGKRLPTEEEWEAAARTSGGYLYPWGNEWRRNACNTEDACIADTTDVDQYAEFQNELGIADMAGNILEWTMTTSDLPIAKTNGKNRIKYQIAKGSSWTSGKDIRLCRRIKLNPAEASNIVGFRCVAV